MTQWLLRGDVAAELSARVRAGIAPTAEQRADFTVVGDAVNVAHRLEKQAAPGEILASEAVQRQVRGSFQMRFAGERRLAGRSEPVNAYAVEEVGNGS